MWRNSLTRKYSFFLFNMLDKTWSKSGGLILYKLHIEIWSLSIFYNNCSVSTLLIFIFSCRLWNLNLFQINKEILENKYMNYIFLFCFFYLFYFGKWFKKLKIIKKKTLFVCVCVKNVKVKMKVHILFTCSTKNLNNFLNLLILTILYLKSAENNYICVFNIHSLLILFLSFLKTKKK